MQDSSTKQEPRNHKGRRILLGILIFLAVIIIGALWYWNTHKKAIIKTKLETAVREKSNGLYGIKYDSLAMDEIGGSLSVYNMTVSYDSARYTQIKASGKSPSMLLNIYVPMISVSGVKTAKALIQHEIVGRRLEIRNPVITIYSTHAGRKDSLPATQEEIYEQLLGDMHLIQADTILVVDATINSINYSTQQKNMQAQGVSATLVNVRIDSSSYADSSRLFFAMSSSFSCRKINWSSANKLYSYTAENMAANSVTHQLSVKSFRIIPSLNEEAFVKAVPVQTDRFDLSLKNIELQNIDLPGLLKENIVADKIVLPSPRLMIYRDLIIPRDHNNRIGTYPHQLMQTLPVNFRVQNIVITDGFIQYKERNNISRQSGVIQYHHVNATIANFTNDKKAIAANNIMRIDMTTRFLDKAPLQVTGKFYLRNPQGRFDINGTFGAMDATFLNPVIEKTGLTHIKSGKVNSASFNIQGSDLAADGKVELLYEDLKVAALEKDKGATQLDQKAISTFIVNFIVKNSNPKRNDPPRIAQVHLDRDPNKSFFNFSWKAIFKGIMETVGLKQ